ncbi:hypothetical protein [Flavobacterium seoulense]|uniref:DUF4890 domain-containing protein n=1 Tax=Flavobacterium seoulense TaxID=1492738 RepID=A0A066WP74_9FLAO|nr:hypothetical protein [Flavobacterium seoulense]KDN55681.1 hypothetical protein FEM21_12830 [Flavobacterium seoulense]
MKKLVILLGLMLATTANYAQNKHKSMKVQRDSIFTVMKLSDENKLKMHNLIAENSKTQKAIKNDATLTEEQRKEKLQTWKKEVTIKEKSILTPEEFQVWRDFAKNLKNKPKE